ncbi:MAG TPA: VWA domain-containing protein [Gaiellaceae bacterium]|nr:VWA domain-containing protein [Gaiellaceae bacterium]
MSFERPWLLLSLLVLASAVGLWLLAERRRARYAIRYTNLDVLASVAGRPSWTQFAAPVLFGLALASLLVALARPQVDRTLTDERATVILVIDASRSMQATDVQPTRLGAAQNAVRTFISRAPSKLRIALIVFAGEAQVATPPTRDHGLVRESVDNIGNYTVFGGTAIGDALRAAVELGKQALSEPPAQGQTAAPASPKDFRELTAASTPPNKQSLVSILFLSDGAQTRGELQPLEGARLAKDAGFPVYTIALGTPTGTVPAPPGFFNFGGGAGRRILVPPDPATLRAIAETTGGKFSEARSAKSLQTAYAGLGSRLGRKPGKSEITFLFVGAAAFLLLAAAVASALTSPRLP